MGILGTKKVKAVAKPDKSMRRGDVYYTSGNEDDYDGLQLIHPRRLQHFGDGTILYEVHVARKIRVNVNATVTEIE